MRNFDNVFFYLAVVSFAFALPHLFKKTKDSRLLNFIGDCTYPLYLSHLLVMYLLYDAAVAPFSALAGADKRFAFIPDASPAGVAMNLFAFLGICIAAGIVLHVLVERPLAAITRQAFACLKSRKQGAARPLSAADRHDT